MREQRAAEQRSKRATRVRASEQEEEHEGTAGRARQQRRGDSCSCRARARGPLCNLYREEARCPRRAARREGRPLPLNLLVRLGVECAQAQETRALRDHPEAIHSLEAPRSSLH